ncbi:hypothetical protein BDV19DRAFT_166107 [Aspergillus venezuelensis]
MEPLKVLICGVGIAGPALAFWLARRGHRLVVVERFPATRASGAQISLQEQDIEAVKRMGLLSIVRSKLADGEGVSTLRSNQAHGGMCVWQVRRELCAGRRTFSCPLLRRVFRYIRYSGRSGWPKFTHSLKHPNS